MACARDIGSEEIIRILKSPEAVKVFRDNGVLVAYLYSSDAERGTRIALGFYRSVVEAQRVDRQASLLANLRRILQRSEVVVIVLSLDSPPMWVAELLGWPAVLFKDDEHETAEFENKMIGMYADWVEHCRVMSRIEGDAA